MRPSPSRKALVCSADGPFRGILRTNNRFGANLETPPDRTIDGVVDAPYTTGCSARKGGSCGFHSAQRQHLLSGAQRAPARKGATVTSGAAGRAAAYNG